MLWHRAIQLLALLAALFAYKHATSNHQNSSFFLISNQWSIRTKSILIKISMKQKKSNRMPQQPQQPLTNAQQPLTNAQQQQQQQIQQQQQQQQPLLTNAQQQMQMQYPAQMQMQYPVQQQMQYPVQQQMQYPVQQQQMVFPGQVQSNVGQRTVGYYGLGSRNLQPAVEEPAIFNDDQPLIEVKEAAKEGGEGKVDITLKAQRSQVKLGEVTVLPAMASVVATGGTRTSVDLVCVIDVSGSMGGEKIELVKETLKFLLETLTPADRLSLITFNGGGRRICGLRTVTQENMVAFSSEISALFASGGTNIMSGMNLALKTIRDRKRPNKVTSVFLLSDGQDRGAEEQLRVALQSEENKDLGVFSIHSFGFGTDHDEDLMNKICLMRDGSFYFIKELATLDEAFCNALGGIISLVASEVHIKLRCVAQGLLQAVTISKVYGDKWQQSAPGQYRIRLTQLMTEASKDFVFELTIPAIAGEVGDVGREHIVIQAILGAKAVTGQEMGGAASLSLTLINTHESIAEENENVDVIENYLRVKAAEAIELNMKRAEANKYEEAQAGIDSMINSIKSNKRARPEKMQNLVDDLQLIREKCSKQEYQQEGKKWMVNAQNAHSNKANYQYSNCVQSQMVQERRSKKANY